MKKIIIYAVSLLVISTIIVIGIKQSNSPLLKKTRNILCTNILTWTHSGKFIIPSKYNINYSSISIDWLDTGIIDGKHYRIHNFNQTANGGIFSGTYELKKKLVSECYGGMCYKPKEICIKVIVVVSGSLIPNP